MYFEVLTRYRFRKVAETRHVMCSEFDVGVGLTLSKDYLFNGVM